MQSRIPLLFVIAAVIVISGPAAARSTSDMLNACSDVAKSYFREGGARTVMKYNGQRVDGTHAINGDIFLENRKESFACSFDRSGNRMTDFFAEGRLRNENLPVAGSSSSGSGMARVKGVPSNDILNVRSGPGANNRIVGALGNDDEVRIIGCENHGGSRWCQIEMQTDMRERGWVNARYLSESGRTSGSSSSSSHINHGSYIENRCAEAVARKVGVSPNDVIVTNSTVSEGTGRHVVYVGVPYAKADWICEADNNGNVINTFYSGE